MQAERQNRGNGFIISPTETFSFPNKNHIQKTHNIPVQFSCIREKLSDTANDCGVYAKKASKKMVRTIISLVTVMICLLGIFRFFTFATGVYCNGVRIASANNEEAFFSAYAKAKAIASTYGIDNFPVKLSTAPVVTLRSSVYTGQKLSDKILLSSNLFIEGCSLYIGDSKVFDAESISVAESAVKDYISSYSMNGNAYLSEEPTYISCVIPKSYVCSKEVCINNLKSNPEICVVSVVNATAVKSVPFETHTENDSTMYIGDSVTVTEGKNGNIEIMEETVYENGKAYSSRIASEKVTAQPVNQVIKVGTKYKNVLECGLHYPLNGVLSSPFGSRWGSVHEGIDIAVSEGTPVKAAECGMVTRVSENAGGYGKLVQIDHGYGVETVYAHLSEIKVTQGQAVSSDTVIGLSGNTGRSTGPHLHFEITQNGTPIDPLKHLK